jgi:hypothetical protein
LEVADGDAVGRGAAEWAELEGADVEGGAEGVEFGLDFGVEGRFVGWEGDAAFSGVRVLVLRGRGGGKTDFAILMGSAPTRL